MASVPTGSQFFIASTIATAKTVSAISNAAEAVVSSTAHGFTNGDIVTIFSSWGRLNKRVFRVKSITADSFVLEGANTTNTTFFPTGDGAYSASASKISAWTQITTVMNPASNGGEPKTVSYKYMESDYEFSINDGFTSTNYTVDLDADSVSSAGYLALRTLTEVQTDTVLRIVTRSNSILLIPCTVALNESVQMQDGQINTVKAAFNGSNRLTRYAA